MFARMFDLYSVTNLLLSLRWKNFLKSLNILAKLWERRRLLQAPCAPGYCPAERRTSRLRSDVWRTGTVVSTPGTLAERTRHITKKYVALTCIDKLRHLVAWGSIAEKTFFIMWPWIMTWLHGHDLRAWTSYKVKHVEPASRRSFSRKVIVMKHRHTGRQTPINCCTWTTKMIRNN